MGEFQPTAAQKNAIEARNRSVLVSAGAGSGKTKVLTERLMSYICPPNQAQGNEREESHPRGENIDRFVIITFTQAAAAELKGRITSELAEAASLHPADRNLRRQQALIRKAQIGTIHHFCAALLREYSQVLSIPSNFKIISEERSSEMKAGALSRVLEDSYKKMNRYEGFEELVNSVGIGRDDSKLAKLLLQLYEKMQSHPRPKVWAKEIVRQLEKSAASAENIWAEVLLENAGRTVKFWEQEMTEALHLIESDEKMNTAYGASFSATADDLHNLGRALCEGWNAESEFPQISFPRLTTLRNPEDPQLADYVKGRREQCKKVIQKLAPVINADKKTLAEEMNRTIPSMKALLELVERFSEEYSKEKQRNGFLDYADLEHKAAELLTDPDGKPTACAAEISERYAEIMVDEYQDVSRVQDEIFKAVSCNGKKLFMVGDVKQSIYRFRLADPEIFNEKYCSFGEYRASLPGEACRILLKENFRSRKAIISCANAVFSACMTKQVGEVDYNDDATLIFGAQGYNEDHHVPQILICGPKKEENPEEPEERTDKKTLEAAYVAKKIADFVSSGEKVSNGKGGERPAEYGDIVILLRSANSIGGIYRRELMRLGIPVVMGQGGDFFESREISVVLSILEIIDNPHMDIPLLTALQSPAFGFTADELSEIRGEDKNSDLYSALVLRAEKDEKCREFLEKLGHFRNTCPDLSAEEIIWMILEETGFRAICSAMPDGEQRNANLMHLLQLAVQFEADGYRGIHSFVLWLRRLAKKGAEVPPEGMNSSSVRIMSIHRSKGLEFPVVFLCGLSGVFNHSDSREAVLVHPELGLGPSYVDKEYMAVYPTLARRAIAMKLKQETVSEEMRLLYVALTRPKEYLFMTAYAAEPEMLIEKTIKKIPSNGGRLSPEDVAECSSMIEWLIAAAVADHEKHIRIKPETYEETSGEETDLKALEAEPDPELLEKLKSNLHFRYPFSEAALLPSKVTATELKGYEQHGGEEDESAEIIEKKISFREPDFMRENRPATGAEKGIATHVALQYMNISKSDLENTVPEEIERLRCEGFLTERQAKAVNSAAIRKLFMSSVGKRIRNADRVWREFRFSVLYPASEIFGKAEGEEILLQGVVDCCIEENEELVIIDYKTDYVKTDDDIKEKCELYAPQIRAYAEALQRIFKKRVKESILYFLSNSKAVSV